MKLRERISTFPNRTMFLGSQSGFMFVGTAEQLIKDIEKLDQANIDALKLRIANYKKLIEKVEDEIKHYKTLLDRDVKEEYEKQTEDGIAVIITGKESGRYWSKDEYDGVCPVEGEQ